jgi:hypothetical protein
MTESRPQPEAVKQLKIDEYITAVREWTVRYGFTPHGLAVAVGLAPGTLRYMFEDDWNPRSDTLRRLEIFMRTHTQQVRQSERARPAA